MSRLKRMKKRQEKRQKKKNFIHLYVVGTIVGVFACMVVAIICANDNKAVEQQAPAAPIESVTTFDCDIKGPRHVFHPYRDGPDAKHDGDVFACEGCFQIRQNRGKK